MLIKQLTRTGFQDFPQVFSIPIAVVKDLSLNAGEFIKHSSLSLVRMQQDAYLRSAVYSKKTNCCIVSTVSEHGALVQDYRLKLATGHAGFKGQKLLHAKIVDTPHVHNHRVHYLTVELANGEKHTIRNKKKIALVAGYLERFMSDNLVPIDTWQPTSLPNAMLRSYLNPNEVVAYYDVAFKRSLIGARICYQLFKEAKPKLTLDDLIAANYLTDYPQIDLPGKLLHKYDTKIDYTFMGLMQKGGVGGNVMNLQTAKRISQYMGEAVTVDALLSQLDNVASVQFGPIRVWALGTATKTTRSLS